MAVEASEPMLCWVIPIAHRTQTPSAFGDHVRKTFFQNVLGEAASPGGKTPS